MTSYAYTVVDPLDVTTLPIPPPSPPFATYVGDRNPQFKMHNTFGHAKSAITDKSYLNKMRTRVVLYQWQGEAWKILEVLEAGDFVGNHLLYSDTKRWKELKGLTLHIIRE